MYICIYSILIYIYIFVCIHIYIHIYIYIHSTVLHVSASIQVCKSTIIENTQVCKSNGCMFQYNLDLSSTYLD